MSALAPVFPKLRPLVRMLGSPIDGEALNAARAIGRVLQSAGSDFHDLARALEAGERGSGERARHDDQSTSPTWFLLTRGQKLAWLEIILDHSEPGGWAEAFALNVRERVATGAPLTTKQAACVQARIMQAWQQGARP